MREQKLDLAVGVVASLVAGFATAVLLAYVTGCAEHVVPSGDTDACERYASQFGADECGVVYEFSQPAKTPSGHVELCVPDRDGLLVQAQRVFGRAEPSPRFDQYTRGFVEPPCAYQCPGARGCNSYSGCFCPSAETP